MQDRPAFMPQASQTVDQERCGAGIDDQERQICSSASYLEVCSGRRMVTPKLFLAQDFLCKSVLHPASRSCNSNALYKLVNEELLFLRSTPTLLSDQVMIRPRFRLWNGAYLKRHRKQNRPRLSKGLWLSPEQRTAFLPEQRPASQKG